MHREPNVGLDPGSPGSRPEPKAGAKPLRHSGISSSFLLLNTTSLDFHSQQSTESDLVNFTSDFLVAKCSNLGGYLNHFTINTISHTRVPLLLEILLSLTYETKPF